MYFQADTNTNLLHALDAHASVHKHNMLKEHRAK